MKLQHEVVTRYIYVNSLVLSLSGVENRKHHLQPDDVYILAGDEVLVTKAGRTTFGLDRFFSGVLQKAVPGIAFFSLALISTKTRHAFPLRLEQGVRTEAEKAASKAKAGAQRIDEAPGKQTDLTGQFARTNPHDQSAG